MTDFKAFKAKLKETEDWLSGELFTIQTGRANPAMLDSVLINSYGSKVHLNQLATVTTEDARTLRIVPWDSDSIQNVESGLRDADLGVGIATDDQGIRVSFPELTTETREKLVKMVNKKLEEARVSVRNERDDVWNKIQTSQKEGEIGEDKKFRLKDEMEKLTKEGNETLSQVAEKKEKELMG